MKLNPKKTLLVLGLVCMALLSGCSTLKNATGSVASALSSPQAGNYTIDVAVLAVSYKKFEPLFEQAKKDVQANMTKLSPNDQAQLQSAISDIQGTLDQVQSMTNGHSNATQIMVSLASLQSIYNSTKDSYLQARAVIARNYSKFPNQAQIDLKALDYLSQQMDRSWQQLSSSAAGTNATAILNNLLTISASVATIVSAGG